MKYYRMRTLSLTQANLSEINQRILVPSYDRKAITTGIVHVGVGGFHRAHQAYYIHRLIEEHNALEWGICGVGIREEDRNIYNVLKQQDFLYTLNVQYPDATIHSQVIGALSDMILAPDEPHKVVAKMSDPDVKIVSLTITEGGYNFNPDTGAFDFENADVRHELQNPDEPKTVFGYLAASLRIRWSQGVAPFSILSCDNIQHNGDVAREMLLSFTKEQDPQLSAWIAEKVSFPNTMVDRITPVTSTDDIAYLEKQHGVVDEWPVVCEPFIQWIVEDQFCNERPALEKLGVQYVVDVVPYEKMKLSLLNAGHSVLGIPGAVHGHATINDCMADPVFASFMRQFMDQEVTPILDELTGIDIEEYKDSLEERFSNPNIKDNVSRICSESSAKLPKFLIPTIQDNLSNGGKIEMATFIVAVWCYYSDKGINEKQTPIDIIDVKKVVLREAASKTSRDNTSFLKLREVFGDLIENERFVEAYKKNIQLIYNGSTIREIMTAML